MNNFVWWWLDTKLFNNSRPIRTLTAKRVVEIVFMCLRPKHGLHKLHFWTTGTLSEGLLQNRHMKMHWQSWCQKINLREIVLTNSNDGLGGTGGPLHSTWRTSAGGGGGGTEGIGGEKSSGKSKIDSDGCVQLLDGTAHRDSDEFWLITGKGGLKGALLCFVRIIVGLRTAGVSSIFTFNLGSSLLSWKVGLTHADFGKGEKGSVTGLVVSSRLRLVGKRAKSSSKPLSTWEPVP